jgi:Na+/melibiose symporter-like transporter
MIFGAVVDKTRTRWGKFRPYLMFLALPGCILTCLYWLMPHLFAGTSQVDILKFVFYLLLTVTREGITTFQTISRTGLMATITPNPIDRTRLITIANFASGFFGEKLPEQAVTILIDVFRGMYAKNPIQLSKAYTGLFVGMGIFTTVASSISSFWFFYNSKERVMQSVKSPSVMESIKSVINNKPLLLITLSEFLSGFAIKGSQDDYYTDVLHFSSMTLVAGIPAAPISPASYAWVPWMRKHFSSRVLYILAKEIQNSTYAVILEKVDTFLFNCNSAYITICTDVFSAAFAPGVSATQALGLDPEAVLPIIKHILRTRKVRGFDICEISPRFDQDDTTAKLGAVIIFTVVNTMCKLNDLLVIDFD